ncbi:LysM peptidoglycan-binding domain-containing protein [Nitrosococcus watsonii]|uniref:Peptidoglycan-binding lysin domain protein n=1 Tax=Nitrosococcus watsoni (strain C-113) TaxID=105559 RepID=D8K462_NITWC|nr:LysM peptidoglycan-binding domain-containing protein [Nitrosococcus watsonii]ADJ27759.1 Peptidoglycan-binding lysin domain protein [Nitrosococcus watsonii C-113]
MADFKRGDSNYVRSAYRRSGSERPEYGRSKNRGQIWSVIIVLLLIVVLAGGAVWMYLNGKGEEEAVVSKESEVASPQIAESSTTEMEPSQQGGTEEGFTSTAPSDEDEFASSTPSEEEDEFASILEELGVGNEPSEEETSASSSTVEPQAKGSAAEDNTAMGAAPEEPQSFAEEEEQFSTEEFTIPEEEQPEEAGGRQTELATGQPRGAGTERQLEETQKRGETNKKGAEEESFAAVTPSFEETPAPSKPQSAGSFPETVTVRSGDSLSVIADRVYGDAGKWRLIYEANQDQLENPDQLLVGMKLTIPAPND